jgi:hypothetical protein
MSNRKANEQWLANIIEEEARSSNIEENKQLKIEINNPVETGVCEVCHDKSVLKVDQLEMEIDSIKKELKITKAICNLVDRWDQTEHTETSFISLGNCPKCELARKLSEAIKEWRKTKE